MKKLLLTLAALVLLTLPAVAVTIDNPTYPGDTQEQAEMLKDIGLFRGTEKGFELTRAMRRDEAAAMLVRYLGAEDKVEAGTWKHPFTDVPAWADKYVGWLYQSGLTKGVSSTRYGAAQAVTCDQYCIFLSRAATGEDAYQNIVASSDEVAVCDQSGFTRSDAVALSARALSVHYTKYGNDMSMAQFLIDKGAFTAEQLKTAAWDVLPRAYTDETKDGVNLGQYAYTLTCSIAGVPVVQNAETDVAPLTGLEQPLNGIYGETLDGKTVLYAIDPRSLATTVLAEYPEGTEIGMIGKVGEADYLVCGKTVIMVRNKAATATGVTCDLLGGASIVQDGSLYAFATRGGIGVIDADGVDTIERPENEKPYAVQDGRIITQDVSADKTVISCLTQDGEVTDSYTVQNDCAAGDDETRLSDAPTLLNHNSIYFWGEAGLYRMQDGRLSQLTARAVMDYGYDSADGSIVFVSHEAGKRVTYSAYAVENPAGDEIVRLHTDGTEQMLLSDTPAHGMTIDKITYATGGRVEFSSLTPTEPRMMGSYTCALENGKVRVLSQTDDITWIYGADAWKTEQARLDALGIGG